MGKKGVVASFKASSTVTRVGEWGGGHLLAFFLKASE